MILYIVLAIALGTVAGIVGYEITARIRRRNCIGALRMDRSDPDEAPYLFLELDPDGMQKIHRYKTVTLRVRIENYLPNSSK